MKIAASSFSPLPLPPPPSSSSSSSSSSSLSPSPSSLFDRLSDVLSPKIIAESLVSRGYAVVDNALDADTCRFLREEIDALRAAGLLRANATFLVKASSSGKGDEGGISPPASSLSSATLLEKRGIWETDSWTDAAVSQKAPLLSSAGKEGAKSLAALLSVLCPEHFSLSGPTILKAQLNDGLGRGGEKEEEEEKERAPSSSREPSPSSSSSPPSPPSFPCFPLHFDSDESVDGRRVTAIFYLSEKKKENPGSKEEGGELLLWPELLRPRTRKRSSTPTVSPNLLPLAIAPVEGRLVLFSACAMPHAVSPSRNWRRHCFTVWLSEGEEERRRRGRRAAEKKEGDDNARGRVFSSAGGRRAVAKVLLSSAWRASLVAAHPAGPALDAALDMHDADTRKLAEVLKRERVVAEVDGSDGGETRWELAVGSESDESDSSPMLWF